MASEWQVTNKLRLSCWQGRNLAEILEDIYYGAAKVIQREAVGRQTFKTSRIRIAQTCVLICWSRGSEIGHGERFVCAAYPVVKETFDTASRGIL